MAGVALREHKGGQTVAETATMHLGVGCSWEWQEWHFVNTGEGRRTPKPQPRFWESGAPGSCKSGPSRAQGKADGGQTEAKTATLR